MIKVRMLVSMTGTRNGAEWPRRGECVLLPEQEAQDMAATGLCAIDDPRSVETASNDAPVETAARKPVRRRKATPPKES